MDSAGLFHGEAAASGGSAAWRDLRVLIEHPVGEIADALDDLVDRKDLPLGFLAFIYVAVWGAVLRTNPPDLRSLLLTFHALEMRALDERATDITDACKLSCQYLQEIDEDDLDWTGFTLPGESN